MTTVLFIRHGRTAANVGGLLAGWTPGVGLDDIGRDQAQALASRLAPVPLAAIVASPLQRCQETAAQLLDQRAGLAVQTDERIGEVRYGDWTGKTLKELGKQPMWQVVQQHPSAAVFPGDGGERLAAMQTRAVDAVREWNGRLGDDATYAVVSHGDVIKAILADALGMHLDLFQRLMVSPCSVSVVQYTPTRPFVVRANDVGGDIAALIPPKRRRGRRSKPSGDAVIGGDAGADVDATTSGAARAAAGARMRSGAA